MSGFGMSPLGGTPYGVGTPATSGATGGSLMPNATGVSQGSRYIDSRTRQYTYDANGHAQGMSNAAHLVLMAVLTNIGSSATPKLGIAPAGGVIGQNFSQEREAAVRNALAQLVTSKIIEIISVDVDITNRPVFTSVRWRDLSMVVEHETKI